MEKKPRQLTIARKITLNYLLEVGRGEVQDPDWIPGSERLREEIKRRLPGFLSKATVTDEDVDIMLGIRAEPKAVVVEPEPEPTIETPEPEPDLPTAPPAPAINLPVKMARPIRPEYDFSHLPDGDMINVYSINYFDPGRDKRSAGEWTPAELAALALGLIKRNVLMTDKTVERAYRNAFDLNDPAWSLEDIVAFVSSGKEPAKTPSGLWLNDITRQGRATVSWTDEELSAWLKEEITCEGVKTHDVLATLRARHNDKSDYSDEQLIALVRDGVEQESIEGVLLDNHRRANLPAREWSKKELQLFAAGKIEATATAPKAVLISRMRAVFSAPKEWSDNQVLEFVASGTTPEKTPEGVWVSDVTRNSKRIEDLTLAEIKSACSGEISLHQVSTPLKLMAVARKRLACKVGDVVKRWSDKEIFDFLTKEIRPTKTRSGLWPNCPIRQELIAREWSKEELVGWIKGEIQATPTAHPSALVDAIYYKWRIDAQATEEEAKSFAVSGKPLQRTARGNLVKSSTRPYRKPIEWTTSELMDYCGGFLVHSQNFVATDELLMKEVHDRFDVGYVLTDERVKILINGLKKEPSTMSLDAVNDFLKKYGERMAPGKRLSSEEMGEIQSEFYANILRVLSLPPAEFNRGWSNILLFVHSNSKTMFSTEMAGRGWDNLSLADRDRVNFERLLNLIRVTANPAGRQTRLRTSVRLDYSLKELRRPEWRDKIVAFYEQA